MHRTRRQPGMGALMLFLQVAQVGLERIPPVTLVVGAINIALFYLHFGWDVRDVCIGAGEVYYGHQFLRLILSAVFHLDEMHLAYNMGSFMWKGVQLEPILGPVKFAWMILVFALLSNVMLVSVSLFLYLYLDYPIGMTQCAVGFSAVIFALKVVLFHVDARSHHQVPFLPFLVPTRWAAWVELVIIQLVTPRASWLGHACGIIAGLVYISGKFQPLFDLPDHVIHPDQQAAWRAAVPRGAADARPAPMGMGMGMGFGQPAAWGMGGGFGGYGVGGGGGFGGGGFGGQPPAGPVYRRHVQDGVVHHYQ